MPDSRRQILALVLEAFAIEGWRDHRGTGQLIANMIAERRDFGNVIEALPADFMAANGVKRKDVARALAQVLSDYQIDSVRGDRKVVILFVAAGPEDQCRLRLAAEHREVSAKVRASTERDRAEIIAALAVRPGDLIDLLNVHRPTVLHLAGHGGPTGIALEDDRGDAVDLATDQLVQLVSLADPMLRLVVLNSCNSASHAEPLTQHVDAAIGMTTSIGDDAARAFAAQLYSSLCEGITLDRAFQQAKLGIDLAGISEADAPALYTRAGVHPDAIILLPKEKAVD